MKASNVTAPRPGFPRTTGKSRRLARQADADRGIRRPGDPIVLVPANQAAERAARRPRPHQRAAVDVVGALNAAARRPRPARVGLFDPTPAQRPSTRRHGSTARAQRTPSAEQRRRQAARDALVVTAAALTVEAQHRPLAGAPAPPPGPLYTDRT